ncbi:MAG: hypothetical protein WCK46_02355 [Candidatus Adlerbacteria bacterium]
MTDCDQGKSFAQWKEAAWPTFRSGITLQEVKEVGARFAGVGVAQLEGLRRTMPLVRLRQALMYFSRVCLERNDMKLYSLEQVGLAYNRHNATALCAVRKIKKLRKNGPRRDGDKEALALLEQLCHHFKILLPTI